MLLQEKLNSILDKATLPADIKLIWQGAFKYLKTEQLLTLLDILSEATPDEVQEFSFNLTNKIAALKNNNADLWRTIIEEEKEKLL